MKVIYPTRSIEERFLSNLDLRGKNCYDIGSHIGVLTVFFAKASGKDGRVIAFEPNPETYLKLKNNVQLNKLNNVEILNIGVGDDHELKKLAVRKHYSGSGSMEEHIQSNIFKEKEFKIFQVQVTTLDACIKKAMNMAERLNKS